MWLSTATPAGWQSCWGEVISGLSQVEVVKPGCPSSAEAGCAPRRNLPACGHSKEDQQQCRLFCRKNARGAHTLASMNHEVKLCQLGAPRSSIYPLHSLGILSTSFTKSELPASSHC